MNTFSLKIKKGMWAYFLYAIFLYILAIFMWPRISVEEFVTYHYTLNFHGAKFWVSILFSLSLLLIINTYYYSVQKVSDKILFFLSVLYFLPGFVLAGVINFEWVYMIEFYVYYLVLVFFDRVITNVKKPCKIFNHKSTQMLKFILVAIMFIYPIYLMRIFGKALSLSNIIMTLNDPYGIRNASRELNVHWVILTIEKWCMYFGSVMITYFFRKKKYVVGSIFSMIGLFYFILQGNRVFFFFIVIAIVLGFVNLNHNGIRYVFLGIVVTLVLEFYLYSNESIGIVTNVFRRFAVVPNMISTSYFDYFQTAEHDWLRDVFTRFFGFLGMESPYGYDINYMIGKQYYGFNMYANNGLFGGAYHEFGALGIVIDTGMLVLMMRIIEKVLMRADNNCKWMSAVVFSTLAINEHVIWTGSFKFSYILMLLLSFLLFFNSEDDSLVEGCSGGKVSKRLIFRNK